MSFMKKIKKILNKHAWKYPAGYVIIPIGPSFVGSPTPKLLRKIKKLKVKL